MTPAEPRVEIEVDGRRLSLSNLDKVLYPEGGLTKAGVIDYYRRIAPVLLPHLAGRPITLVRFPDGAGRPGFFEKNCPGHRPEWVRTAPFSVSGRRGRSSGEVVVHCLVEDLPTLVWLANLAALELHAPMARADDPDHPTTVVFDLDPGAPAAVRESCRQALALRDVLDGLGLAAFPKTSGKKGVHVYLPLNRTGPDQEQCQDFARAVAELMAKGDPDQVTTTMAKAARGGKVFVDWSQNTRHKTTVAPYSLRAGPVPSVSAPLTWDEVAGVADGADPDTLRFGPDEVHERVETHGDLFQPVLDMVQELPPRGTRAPG